MNDLVVIVEGQTEQTFVRQHLAPFLRPRGLVATAVLPGRRKNHGGVPEWSVARDDVVRTLESGACCTTMFDYYGLPHNWPGRERASRLPYTERADHVEEAIRIEVRRVFQAFDDLRFVPYIQLHEFEALAFADPDVLASVVAPTTHGSTASIARQLREILKSAGGDPEAINDGYETCPSRRIKAVAPGYKKVLHGSIVTGRIGLNVLYDRCRHFADWIDRLAAMAQGNALRATA